MIFGGRWLRLSPWTISGDSKPAGAPNSIPYSLHVIAALSLTVACVCGVGAAGRTLLDPSRTAAAAGTIVTVGEYKTTGDDWMERLSDPSAWRSGRYSSGLTYRRSWREEEDEREWREPDEDKAATPDRPRYHGTYRTVCVRLCDGSFHPISFSTTPDNFARDEARCQSGCRIPARLYVYPNPGGEPEQMVSVTGQPYTALNTAFLFRTKYDAACTCKPHPWEQEALARHRAYAETQRNRTTAKVAKTEPPPSREPDRPGTAERRRARPEGVMLLGADQHSRPREGRRSEARTSEPPRNQRGGSYGRRSDWQSRAFGGY